MTKLLNNEIINFGNSLFHYFVFVLIIKFQYNNFSKQTGIFKANNYVDAVMFLSKKIRAVGLFSRGLDSTLAAKT